MLTIGVLIAASVALACFMWHMVREDSRRSMNCGAYACHSCTFEHNVLFAHRSDSLEVPMHVHIYRARASIDWDANGAAVDTVCIGDAAQNVYVQDSFLLLSESGSACVSRCC